MSQRTRTRPASATTASPTASPTDATSQKTATTTTATTTTTNAAKVENAEHGAASPAEAAPALLSAVELARALRAVAEEVERDPALARRVGEAMRGGDESVPLRPSRNSADASVEHDADKKRVAPSIDVAHGGNQAPSPLGEDGDRGQEEAPRRTPRGRSFTPRLITGAPPELGAGVPDPFALRARLGEEGLRAELDELRLGTLRAMIREHALDPSGRLAGLNDADKLRERILAATARPRREAPTQTPARGSLPVPTDATPRRTPRKPRSGARAGSDAGSDAGSKAP